MSKPSLREDILNAGLKVMFRSGYQGATVRDICAAAGAPHGSFTNHFRSKEAFAKEVLDRFFATPSRVCQGGFGRQVSYPPAATEAVSGDHQRRTERW
jgi:AcrR family transcriptional regulator